MRFFGTTCSSLAFHDAPGLPLAPFAVGDAGSDIVVIRRESRSL